MSTKIDREIGDFSDIMKCLYQLQKIPADSNSSNMALRVCATICNYLGTTIIVIGRSGLSNPQFMTSLTVF